MSPASRWQTSRALATARMFDRYAVGIRRFLYTTLTADDCRRIVRTPAARRESSFRAMLEHGVYANPRSPYRQLLVHSGGSCCQ